MVQALKKDKKFNYNKFIRPDNVNDNSGGEEEVKAFEGGRGRGNRRGGRRNNAKGSAAQE